MTPSQLQIRFLLNKTAIASIQFDYGQFFHALLAEQSPDNFTVYERFCVDNMRLEKHCAGFSPSETPIVFVLSQVEGQ